MNRNNGKRVLIHLSDDDDDNDVISSSSGDDCQLIDDNDDDDYGVSDDNDDDYCSSDSDEEEEDDDDDDDEKEDRCEEIGDDNDDDDESLFNRVVLHLREKRDLQVLSLKACKSYLRRHGLRVSGNKEVCVQRVLEHWRIKDGKAEVFYPRSSFNINCKGDVCRGDIVLFTQKVYGRNGKQLGNRTIAGRVVKESYGAAKQQHTFTVEVLWSKGVKKLPLLFPLLVKGRNLYRFNTHRQPWKNEGKRRQVLAEKHRRGTTARSRREKRKNAWSTGKGLKSQKIYHVPGSSKMSSSRGGKAFGREQGASTSKHTTTNNTIQQSTLKLTAIKHTTKTKSSRPREKHQNTISRTHHTTSRINQKPSGGFHYRSMPFESRIVDHQGKYPYHGPVLRPAAHYASSYNSPCYMEPPRMVHENYLQYFPSVIASEPQRYGLSRCSIQGCIDPGSDRCVIGACWRCCRSEGFRCTVHR